MLLLFPERVFNPLYPAFFSPPIFLRLLPRWQESGGLPAVFNLALPAGFILGVFMHQYAGLKEKRFLLALTRIWGSVPSLIMGIFGFLMMLFLRRMLGLDARPSLMLSAFSLSLLILPYGVFAVFSALQGLPQGFQTAGPALGAKKLQNLFFVLLPLSLPRMSAGFLLAAGRALEDTAVIMLTGSAALAGFPSGLLNAFEALPFFIFTQSAEHHDEAHLARTLIAALIMLILAALLGALTRKLEKKSLYQDAE